MPIKLRWEWSKWALIFMCILTVACRRKNTDSRSAATDEMRRAQAEEGRPTDAPHIASGLGPQPKDERGRQKRKLRSSSATPKESLRCQYITRCLARSLPRQYRHDQRERVYKSIEACIGSTVEEIWAARDCLPYEFGRDVQNGKKLAVSVTCSDVCPSYASYRVSYVDVDVGGHECLCIGGRELHSPGFGGYVACGPSDVDSERRILAHVTTKQEENRTVFQVLGVVYGSRAEFSLARGYKIVGLSHLDKIASVDGKPVKSAAEVEALFERLLDHPPRVVTSYRDHVIVHTHYVALDVIERLRVIAGYVGFFEGGIVNRCSKRTSGARISFGNRSREFDDACTDDVTKRMKALARQIEIAASTSIPPRRPFRKRDCRMLDDIGTSVSLRRDDEILDLRYIGWVPSSTTHLGKIDRTP